MFSIRLEASKGWWTQEKYYCGNIVALKKIKFIKKGENL